MTIFFNLPVAKYICKVHILSLINEARNSERNLLYVTIEGNLGINPVLPTCLHQNVTICGTHLLPGSYTHSTLISYCKGSMEWAITPRAILLI